MLSQELLSVINRDHTRDVSRLNSALSLHGDGELVDIPPHIFVGNISKLNHGDCILLMGINPRLSQNEKFERVNINLPTKCLSAYRQSGNPKDLEDWLYFQENYFLQEERNKSHFGKFGHWFGSRWFQDTYHRYSGAEASQMTLHNHVVEVDALQYFSKSASIEPSRFADLIEKDPALVANMRLIEWIIDKVQPKWIQINGKSNWTFVDRCFMGSTAISLNDGDTAKTEIMVGHARIGRRIIPVFMHKFLNMSGPQRKDERLLISETWDNWYRNESHASD